MLRDNADDITAFAGFPVSHWKKISSANPPVVLDAVAAILRR
jgi:hypothetical protein